MPMRPPRLDHHDITRLERERRSISINDDTGAAQPEKELGSVVLVPMRAGSFVEGDPVQPDSGVVGWAHQPLKTGGHHEVEWVGFPKLSGARSELDHGIFLVTEGSLGRTRWHPDASTEYCQVYESSRLVPGGASRCCA